LYKIEGTAEMDGTESLPPRSPDGLVPDDGVLPFVLLVEDELAIREALAVILRDRGVEVLFAANGIEALDLLQRGVRPAAILLDLMMPGMDGWDFRQRQLEDARLAAIPTIVVTGAGFSVQSIRAQFGDVGFVPKPFDEDALFAAIERARCAAPVVGAARAG
jgi:CheY-like chemotaxis protein